MTHAVERAFDRAARRGRLKIQHVRETPSVAAARQIDDRDVIERYVAQQLVRAKFETQILLGCGTHCHGQWDSLLSETREVGWRSGAPIRPGPFVNPSLLP